MADRLQRRKSGTTRFWCRRSSMLLGWCLVSSVALAEVSTDGSVGAAGSIGKVGNDFGIPASLGTKAGGNLFHSFSQFNLNGGESATFSGPNDVSNVLARVTGGSASNIDGTLRSTIPGANLFFINPKGVIFGPNAHLEIDGSFTATTADYVKLSGGGRFDATTPANDVLTSAPVSAFGFLSAQPAAISATSSVLTAGVGKKVSLVGGDLSLDRARLTAPSGRVDLWSAKGVGEVGASDGAGALGGRINLLRTTVDVSGAPSGNVVIRGGQLTLDRSPVLSNNTGAGAGGNIDVAVSGAVTLQLAPSQIFTSTTGSGSAGNVSVRAASVQLSRDAVIGSQATATTTKTARAGDVRVTAKSVSVSDGATISASTFGLGKGGIVDVDAGQLSIAGNPAEGTTAGIFPTQTLPGRAARAAECGSTRTRCG